MRNSVPADHHVFQEEGGGALGVGAAPRTTSVEPLSIRPMGFGEVPSTLTVGIVRHDAGGPVPIPLLPPGEEPTGEESSWRVRVRSEGVPLALWGPPLKPSERPSLPDPEHQTVSGYGTAVDIQAPPPTRAPNPRGTDFAEIGYRETVAHANALLLPTERTDPESPAEEDVSERVSDDLARAGLLATDPGPTDTVPPTRRTAAV